MTKRRGKQQGRGGQKQQAGRGWKTRTLRAYPVTLRLKAVEQVERGVTVAEVARVFGPMEHTIRGWLAAYRKGGVEALVPKPVVTPVRKPKAGSALKREAVLAQKESHPEYGTRRVRDALARFEALGVSEHEVRRILGEAGLLGEAPAGGAREHPPRRFERARPNQLWQSDIFTFLLRRQERLYLTIFMDDHSRFVVSHALAHHQRGDLVVEAVTRGIAAYGTPEEVLTDQGRQYTAWRGETEFERELRRQGIRAHQESAAASANSG